MRRATALLPIFASLAACGSPQGGEPNDAQHDQRSAVLFVERQASDGTNASSHVGARFVQFAGLDAAALPDLLGTPGIPTGAQGCRERADTAVDMAGGRAEAQLLDVGTIEVRGGDHVLQLEPHRFPDLWNVVSGVIYGTDDEMPLGVLRFSAAGNAQSRIGAFEVEAHAPDDLAGVTVAEQPLTAGGSVALPGHAFGVRWARGDLDDTVVVAFDGTGAERPTTILCTARDEGALDVDAGWAERIASAVRAGGRVAVHRVRARAFTAPQVDSANVVFDLSVRGTLRAE